jgi:ribosome-binding factor A
MGKKYQRRVGKLIQQKITQLLLRESNDPRLALVTITDVVVNRDTTRAEVYYSIIGTAEELAEVQAALEKAAPWLRAEMKPTLRLRHVPQLVFIYDPSLERGERIESLLSQIQQAETEHEEDEA